MDNWSGKTPNKRFFFFYLEGYTHFDARNYVGKEYIRISFSQMETRTSSHEDEKNS